MIYFFSRILGEFELKVLLIVVFGGRCWLIAQY